ncbi:MAG: PC4/YdbC family ssDNA-binding protein [Clostridia bacterium]
MENQKQGEVPRNIENRFGSISKTDHSNIEVNIIRWNNGRKKLDIRVWSSDGKCPKKGITFSREEYYQLIRILSGIDPMLIDCGKALSAQPLEVQKELAAVAADRIEQYQETVEEACTDGDEYVELETEEMCGGETAPEEEKQEEATHAAS